MRSETCDLQLSGVWVSEQFQYGRKLRSLRPESTLGYLEGKWMI